jgi:hypothetical protein
VLIKESSSDLGVGCLTDQYTDIRFTKRLVDAGSAIHLHSRGSHDRALFRTSTINGLVQPIQLPAASRPALADSPPTSYEVPEDGVGATASGGIACPARRITEEGRVELLADAARILDDARLVGRTVSRRAFGWSATGAWAPVLQPDAARDRFDCRIRHPGPPRLQLQGRQAVHGATANLYLWAAMSCRPLPAVRDRFQHVAYASLDDCAAR